MAKWLKNTLCALVGAAILAGPAAAKEVNPQGYVVPDVTQAKYLGKKEKKIDGHEAILKGYIAKDGTKFTTLALAGQSRPSGYNIHGGEQYVDSDCDGKYELKLEHEEHWDWPNCALEQN